MVYVLEANADWGFGFGAGLVEAELLRGLVGMVFGPINLRVLQVLEVDLIDGWLLVEQGVFGVRAPVVRGGDYDSLGEAFLPGGGEEAVDVALQDGVIGLIALALDGVVFLGAVGLGDEVDAGVLGTEAELGRADFFGPIRVEPDIGIEVGVAGLKAQVGADEFLEVGAFFPLGLAGDAVVGACKGTDTLFGRRSSRWACR